MRLAALAAAVLVAACLAGVNAEGKSFWGSEALAKSESAKHGALLDSKVRGSLPAQCPEHVFLLTLEVACSQMERSRAFLGAGGRVQRSDAL